MKYPKYAAILVASGLVLGGVCAGAQAPAEIPAAGAEVVPQADQPTDAQIAKLFDVMRVKEQMASVTKMMPQIMQQQFNQQLQQMQKDHPEMTKLSPEQQQAYSKIMARYSERVMQLAAADDILADLGAIYKRHLTGADLDGAIGFFSSPAGQHLVNITPAVMQEFMPAVMHRTQERIKPIADELQKELMQEFKPGPVPDTATPAQK
jgi:hypothetical protein